MLTGCVYMDGRFLPPDEARISPFDHGYLYGDGLFETLRTYGGIPFRLPEHLRRLEQGLALLGMEGAPTAEVLTNLVEQTVARSGLPEVYLRITVTRGVSHRGLDPAGCGTPTVMIAALPLRAYPEKQYQQGIQATCLWARGMDEQPPPTVKSTSFQRGVLARRELTRRGAGEGFYLDGEGNVTEGSVSNVFAVFGDRLRTPPAHVCLPGITRAEVLSLAAECGLVAEEAPLPRGLLTEADEIFITSSLAELLPVTRIDGIPVGRGVPGPVHQRLHERYLKRAKTTTTEGSVPG